MSARVIPEGLAAEAPGPALCAVLAELEPARVANADTVDVLQACRRMRSYLDAQELALMAEVGRCDPSAPTSTARLAEAGPECGREIAAALTLTELTAWREHALAEMLIYRLPDVHAALRCGDLDLGKARVFADLLEPLSDAQIQRVCATLLSAASTLTTGQLRARLRRMVIAIDPEAAQRRYRKAVQERRVVCYLDDNGTATIAAIGLDPAAAQAACERLDGLARAIRAAGHPEPLPSIRLDLSAALLDGSLHTLSREQIIATMLARAAAAAAVVDDAADTGAGQGTDKGAGKGAAGHGTGGGGVGAEIARRHAGDPDDAPDNGPDDGPGDGGTSNGGTGDGGHGDSGHGDSGSGDGGTGDDGSGAGGPGDGDAGDGDAGDGDAGDGDAGDGDGDPHGDTDADGPGTDDLPNDGSDTEADGSDTDDPGNEAPDSDDPGDDDPNDDPDTDGPSDPGGPGNGPQNPDSGPAGPGAPADPAGGAETARPGIEVRVRLSTLLGHDDHPGEIPGLGPVLACISRAQVARQHQGEWRFAVTDADGYLLLAGLTRRRPPEHPLIRPAAGGIVELQVPADLLARLTLDPPPGWAPLIADLAAQYARRDELRAALDEQPDGRMPHLALRRHVEIRDRTCSFPGCRRSACKAQQDHTQEHQHGGPSVSANLGPLCPLHHAIKTAGRWRLSQPAPGIFRWQSPLQRVYSTRGEPVCPPVPEALPEPVDEPAPAPVSRGQRELDNGPIYPPAPPVAPKPAPSAPKTGRAPPDAEPPF